MDMMKNSDTAAKRAKHKAFMDDASLYKIYKIGQIDGRSKQADHMQSQPSYDRRDARNGDLAVL